MQNFTLHTPTKVLFGTGQIAQLSKEIPADARILITYGGGSIKQNGVLDQVHNALKGFDFLEFGGIEPNPTYETLMKAVELIRAEKSTSCWQSAVVQYWMAPSSSLPLLTIHKIHGTFWKPQVAISLKRCQWVPC